VTEIGQERPQAQGVPKTRAFGLKRLICSLFPLHLPPAESLSDGGNRPGLMRVVVADKVTGVRRSIVGDGEGAIRSDDFNIKIHQSLA